MIVQKEEVRRKAWLFCKRNSSRRSETSRQTEIMRQLTNYLTTVSLSIKAERSIGNAGVCDLDSCSIGNGKLSGMLLHDSLEISGTGRDSGNAGIRGGRPAA